MHRILVMCLNAALASILLVPMFWFLNRRYYHNPLKSCCYMLFAVYLCAVYAVVGLPTVDYMRFCPRFNMIPFRYLFSDFTNSFLNVLLFLPLGISLPLFWHAYRKFLPTICFGLSASLLIELLQIFTLRATDVNDLITNTFGTVLGWCLAQVTLRLLPLGSGWDTKELYSVCVAAFGVMYFFQPFLAKQFFPLFF